MIPAMSVETCGGMSMYRKRWSFLRALSTALSRALPKMQKTALSVLPELDFDSRPIWHIWRLVCAALGMVLCREVVVNSELLSVSLVNSCLRLSPLLLKSSLSIPDLWPVITVPNRTNPVSKPSKLLVRHMPRRESFLWPDSMRI